jgi:hypothetical protein
LGYFAIGAQIIPDSMHGWVLKRLTQVGKKGARKESDVFPTFYRINTAWKLSQLTRGKFDNHSFYTFGPPAYYANSMILARFIQCYNQVVPAFLQPYLMIFLQKPLESNDTVHGKE